ncbi:Zinc finger BED domain-containing protein 5 [Trichinella zimbabwensis]|uniref:Zinc finger BED domain-containing protein 5 n=1 Tax=Trichinella zimbabwensis TaxID=268475 RepID=A0A0V1HTS6_9BILA|nr:Zinc finger BED domain-containing protein 5 [Trichinella zimbabwensis]
MNFGGLRLLRQGNLQHARWLNKRQTSELEAALASKTLPDKLKNVLDISMKIVNYIKSRPLQCHLLEVLCEDMGSIHYSLLLHTEVRWLSRRKVLTRLVQLREGVAVFLDKSSYAEYLRGESFVLNEFSKLNQLNFHLQGLKASDILVAHDKI